MVELKKELIRVEANSPPSTRPPITKHVAQSTLEVLEIASRLAALSATAILSACDYRCGAGEGNRTLLFSLEVDKLPNVFNRHSDIVQPCGRLRLRQNFSLSEWNSPLCQRF